MYRELTVLPPLSSLAANQADSSNDGLAVRLEDAAAVVAVAGYSRRMGRFKPLLPWGKKTVIESVVDGLFGGGAAPVLVVTGHRAAEVADRLVGGPACVVFNPDYARHEMLRSYQIGIETLLDRHSSARGALLALGDQPHIPASVIGQIIDRARAAPDAIVIPSHNRRRGHPVYLPRRLFPDLLGLQEGQTLRDLLNRCVGEIVYAPMDSDSIRRDMDAPAEYEALWAEFGKTS